MSEDEPEDKNTIDIEAVQDAYENSDLTLPQMAEKFGMSRQRISRYAKKYGWKPRNMPAGDDRKSMIKRLMKMLERQIAHLENNMTGSDDKEAALLVSMSRTLEKLVDLDKKETGGDTARPDRKMRALRQKLAARIEHLRKH